MIRHNYIKRRGLAFYRKKKKVSIPILKEIGSWLFVIAISIFIAFVLVFTLGMRVSMIGVSMEPTLNDSQIVLVNRFGYLIMAPKRGDIIAFLPNGNEDAHYYIKRVVAVPGDVVEIIDGKLYINGMLSTDILDKIADPGVASRKTTLAVDEFFVLGDNINNSEDSRSANLGNAMRDTIAGRVWFKFKLGQNAMGMVK